MGDRNDPTSTTEVRFKVIELTIGGLVALMAVAALIVSVMSYFQSQHANSKSADLQTRQFQFEQQSEQRDRDLSDRQQAAANEQYADDLVFNTYRHRKHGKVVGVTVDVKNFSPRPLHDMRFETTITVNGRSQLSIIPLVTVPTCWRVSYQVPLGWWSDSAAVVFSDINGRYWKRTEDRPVSMSGSASSSAIVYKAAFANRPKGSPENKLDYRKTGDIHTCG